MKFDKIKSLFKKAEIIYLFNKISEDGEITQQFIGGGAMCYALENLPVFDGNTICGLLERDRSETDIKVCPAPEWLIAALDYDVDGDIPLYAEPYSAFDCKVFTTYQDCANHYDSVCCFANPGYFAPFTDGGEYDYVARKLYNSDKDVHAVIVREGMYTQAAIMPIIPHDDNLKKWSEYAGKIYSELKRVERINGGG